MKALKSLLQQVKQIEHAQILSPKQTSSIKGGKTEAEEDGCGFCTLDSDL